MGILFLFLSAGSFAQQLPVTVHLDPGPLSNDGHVRLDWSAPAPGLDYVVQRAPTKAFKSAHTIYKGPDLATFVSGLRNGSYFFRVRTADGPWSSPVKLTVRHHSLKLAFTLFGLGAVVFLLTVGVVVKGAYLSSKQQA